MAFKIPTIPKVGMIDRFGKHNYKGLPLTKESTLDFIKLIGRGSFGIVKLCKQNETQLIMKEMVDSSNSQEPLFIKEAKVMLSAVHENIVRFHSVVESRLPNVHAYLMEYVYFDFKEFGREIRASSLKDFLEIVDSFDCSEFEHLNEFIARDVCDGLAFLHDSGIVHRDLKPDNVLVSNQHYTGEDGIRKCWHTKPVVAKLTDFGESRSELIQTADLLHTRTTNVYRGTPVFMAPELHLGTLKSASMSDLKASDVWSLGMTLFALVNPDLNYPYEREFKTKAAGVKNSDVIRQLLQKQTLPNGSDKYRSMRHHQWVNIHRAYQMCVKFADRPDVKTVLGFLDEHKKLERNIFLDFEAVVCEDNTSEVEKLTHAEDVRPLRKVGQSTELINDFQRKSLRDVRMKNCHEVAGDGQATEEYSLPSLSKNPGGCKSGSPGLQAYSSRGRSGGGDQNSPVSAMPRSRLRSRSGSPDGSHARSQSRNNDSDASVSHVLSGSAKSRRGMFQTQRRHRDEPVSPVETMPPGISSAKEVVGIPGSPRIPISLTTEVSQSPASIRTELPSMTDPSIEGSQSPASIRTELPSPTAPSKEVSQSPASISTELPSHSSSSPHCRSGASNSDQVEGYVSADFHQASSCVFKHEAAGAQCSTMCLTAAVAAQFNTPKNWTPLDLNEILQEGDTLHMKILKGKGWPNDREEPRLDIDELPKEVNLNLAGYLICARVSVLNNIVCGLGSDIRLLIEPLMQADQLRSVLLRIDDKCRTIFFDRDKTVSVFDPHSCNEVGETDGEGSACLLKFSDLDGFTKYVQKVIGHKPLEQIDLAVCDIDIVSTFHDGMGDAVVDDDVPMAGIGSDGHTYNSGENRHYEGTFSETVEPDGHDTEDDDDVIIIMNSKTEKRTREECPDLLQKEKGLSIKDILTICALENVPSEKLCDQIPAPKGNTVFAINLQNIPVEDLPCDDSGAYDKHSCPTTVVEMDALNGTIRNMKTLSRRKLAQGDVRLSHKNVYTIKRTYSMRNDTRGLGNTTRIISKVYSHKGLCKVATIQYLGNASSAPVNHGNCKDRKRPYIRTKQSVIDREKTLLEKEPPKKVISQIDRENGGPINMISSSDGPRDRCQLYNLKRKMLNKNKSRNTGPIVRPDFSKLIAELDTGKFVKNIDFSFRTKHQRIYPNTFAMTDNAANWIKTFCSPTSKLKSQLGIDMTYKVGPYYTTCMSLPHPYLVHKNNKLTNPTLFAGLMTSTGRMEDDYRYLASQVNSCGVKRLIYGTDGELALEKGFEAIFPIETSDKDRHSIKLRCFIHAKDDMLAELKKTVTLDRAHTIVNEILGKEINGVRFRGLVDAATAEFDAQYQLVSQQWPPSFKQYMESEAFRVRSLKSTLKKCMGKDVRMNAGLGDPPHKFDNQRAESINSILKESIGDQYVNQSEVHGLVYDNIVIPQENEMMKAIYGSGEYRLAGEFKRYELTLNQWKSMTEQQRQTHVAKIQIGKPLDEHATNGNIRKLSVQPDECKEYLQALPHSRIIQLWKEAERILSADSIRELETGNFCITDGDNAYIVKQYISSLSCNCSTFKKINICPHCLVAADQKNTVLVFLSTYKYDPSIAVNKHNSKGAGEKKTKKPRKGAQNVKRIPLERYANMHSGNIDLQNKRPFQYCEIWHNDEDFVVQHVGSQHISRKPFIKCASCGNIISRKNAVPPYDIIFTHRERYMYPCQLENGETEMRPTRVKLAMRFYCLKRTCLLSRHPYFWQGIINSQSVELQECHRILFKTEFGIDV